MKYLKGWLIDLPVLILAFTILGFLYAYYGRTKDLKEVIEELT